MGAYFLVGLRLKFSQSLARSSLRRTWVRIFPHQPDLPSSRATDPHSRKTHWQQTQVSLTAALVVFVAFFVSTFFCFLDMGVSPFAFLLKIPQWAFY